MDPVSHLSFNCPKTHEAETVPFTDDLQHQHDEEILCMPYEFTPFLLTDLVRASSFQKATISKKFRFDPSSVKDNLVGGSFVYINLSLTSLGRSLPRSIPNLPPSV